MDYAIHILRPLSQIPQVQQRIAIPLHKPTCEAQGKRHIPTHLERWQYTEHTPKTQHTTTTMYKEQIDMTRVPRHVAIIMDGNGRWAKAQGKERTFGHQEGAERVHDIMTAAVNLGIDYLTLYTFSTENWNRPETE